MNKKGEVCLGVAVAGRATEMHMNALKRSSGLLQAYYRTAYGAGECCKGKIWFYRCQLKL